MGPQFGTQVEQMQAAAAHVEQVNQSVQGQLKALYSQLEPLAGAWKGQAALAFQMLMDRWTVEAHQLNDALHEIGEQIRGSGATYAHADEAEQQNYSRIISQALSH